MLLEGRAAGPGASGPAGGRGSADRLSPESVGCDIFSWRSILVFFFRGNRQPCGPASEFFSGSSAVASAVRSSVYADNAWGSSVVMTEILHLTGTGRNAGRAGGTSRASARNATIGTQRIVRDTICDLFGTIPPAGSRTGRPTGLIPSVRCVRRGALRLKPDYFRISFSQRSSDVRSSSWYLKVSSQPQPWPPDG